MTYPIPRQSNIGCSHGMDASQSEAVATSVADTACAGLGRHLTRAGCLLRTIASRALACGRAPGP